MEPQKSKRILRIVLTGGPCGKLLNNNRLIILLGGKTSALEHLSMFIKALGYNVLCVPEGPTILMQGGNNDHHFFFGAL
jgi:hypothetical protein